MPDWSQTSAWGVRHVAKSHPEIIKTGYTFLRTSARPHAKHILYRSLRHMPLAHYASCGNCYLASSCRDMRIVCGSGCGTGSFGSPARPLRDLSMPVRARLAYPSEPPLAHLGANSGIWGAHYNKTVQNEAKMMPNHNVRQLQNIMKHTKPMLHMISGRLETSPCDLKQGPRIIVAKRWYSYYCSLMWYSCDKDARY